jgi:chorismate synthase
VPAPHALFEDEHTRAIEASSLRMLSPEHEARARARIHALSHAGDTAGGVFEVVAVGVPVGLGSHVHWDKRLDARIAHAVMSVPAVKAVEIGDGWESAQRSGAQVHDPIAWDATTRTFHRGDNHAGGVEGGMSNGAPVVVRAAMKPLPTLREPLGSVDLATLEPAPAFRERSDVCAVPAAGVIAEAMLCLVLADAMLEKFGGDAVEEWLSNVEAFRARGP